jgi:hypothetical protein
MNKIDLLNELENLRFKFNSPRSKKLSKEFNLKVNEIKQKILLTLTKEQCQ